MSYRKAYDLAMSLFKQRHEELMRQLEEAHRFESESSLSSAFLEARISELGSFANDLGHHLLKAGDAE